MEEGTPIIGYDVEREGTIWFFRVCSFCHRFVKAGKARVTYNGFGDVHKVTAFGQCAKHGEVEMPCLGWF